MLDKKRFQILTSNKIKCRHCEDVIESTDRHDFKFCSCGAIAVDGGNDYWRRIGKPENILEGEEVEAEYVSRLSNVKDRPDSTQNKRPRKGFRNPSRKRATG